MKVTHNNRTYECNVAVKCEIDKYIKLYDENGAEIASFYNISDFSKYTISGGSFVDPCDCSIAIPVSKYVIGGRTITTNNWILSDDGKYIYEIENDVISGNATTCDILLLFAKGTSLSYEATQEDGKLTLSCVVAPTSDIVIDSIQITRA